MNASKVAESVNNKFYQLHSKVDSTMELKLSTEDSAASSKRDTTLLTDTLLSSIDKKVIQKLKNKFEIQSKSGLDNTDSKVT